MQCRRFAERPTFVTGYIDEAQPTTPSERLKVTRDFDASNTYATQLLVDGMENRADESYAGSPRATARP